MQLPLEVQDGSYNATHLVGPVSASATGHNNNRLSETPRRAGDGG